MGDLKKLVKKSAVLLLLVSTTLTGTSIIFALVATLLVLLGVSEEISFSTSLILMIPVLAAIFHQIALSKYGTRRILCEFLPWRGSDEGEREEGWDEEGDRV